MGETIFYPSLDGVRLCAVVDAASNAKGSVVLAHGITVDKDESSGAVGVPAFVELAARLTADGYNVLRFDFRGHGESGLTSRQMTIAGELLDLIASVRQAETRWGQPVALVGASFGAVSSVLYAAGIGGLACLVLWNPVLDLRQTFLEPVEPIPQQFFNAEGYAHLAEHGWLSLDGFEIGACLVDEMRYVEPFARMSAITCPVLTLHGDRDRYVPYGVAQQYAGCNPASRFLPVPGAEHGFGMSGDRALVLAATVQWLDENMISIAVHD